MMIVCNIVVYINESEHQQKYINYQVQNNNNNNNNDRLTAFDPGQPG